MRFGLRVNLLRDAWVYGSTISLKSGLSEEVVPPLVASLIDPHSYVWNVSLVRRLFDNDLANQVLALDLESFCLMVIANQVWSLSPNGCGAMDPGWWRKFWGLPILSPWKSFHLEALASRSPDGGFFVSERSADRSAVCVLWSGFGISYPFVSELSRGPTVLGDGVFWSFRSLLPTFSDNVEDWCVQAIVTSASGGYHLWSLTASLPCFGPFGWPGMKSTFVLAHLLQP